MNTICHKVNTSFPSDFPELCHRISTSESMTVATNALNHVNGVNLRLCETTRLAFSSADQRLSKSLPL